MVAAAEVGQLVGEDAAPSVAVERLDQRRGEQELGTAQAPEHRRAQLGDDQQLGRPDAELPGDPIGLRDQVVRGGHGEPEPAAEPEDPPRLAGGQRARSRPARRRAGPARISAAVTAGVAGAGRRIGSQRSSGARLATTSAAAAREIGHRRHRVILPDSRDGDGGGYGWVATGSTWIESNGQLQVAPGHGPGPGDQGRGHQFDQHRQPEDMPGRRADRTHPARHGRDRGQGQATSVVSANHPSIGAPPSPDAVSGQNNDDQQITCVVSACSVVQRCGWIGRGLVEDLPQPSQLLGRETAALHQRQDERGGAAVAELVGGVVEPALQQLVSRDRARYTCGTVDGSPATYCLAASRWSSVATVV